MRANAKTIVSLLCAISCTVLVLGSCSNSTGPSGSGYLDPTSPENVLLNLARAYGDRDLDEYLACMSDDFKFYFTAEDQQGWPELPPWFYKSDERQVHENMFDEEGTVVSIELALEVTAVETIPGGDPGLITDDVVVIHTDADLRVDLQGDLSFIATTPQDFYFRTVLGWDGRGGRAEWEMFEWRDQEDGNSGARVEEAGWGGIKYLFLESLSEPSRRTSPAEVLDQLKAAYIAMDVTDYLDCLSEDFIFFPAEEDVQNPDLEIPPEWYKTDEQTMHENMFDEGSSVESITLVLTDISIDHDPGQDPQDPLDDTYVCWESVILRVNLYGGLTLLATEPSRFHLRVDQDEAGPYGEIMWEAYKWYENPVQRGSDGREDKSWGGIKAMFR